MKEDTEAFHNRHEHFTRLLYDNPGMLPHRYVFVLTTRCNLRCPFCYQSQKGGKDPMAPKDWMRVGEQLPDYARVTLTGGEPLLYDGFEEIFAYIAGRFDCNIITNGVLLTERLVDALLSYPRFRVLSVSIDSVRNTIRGISPERWEKVEGMIRYFLGRREELGHECLLDAKTTVLDENAHDLLDIHRYCVEEFLSDHHSLQFLKGSSIQHAERMFSLEDALHESRAPIYRNFGIIKGQLEKIRQYDMRHHKKSFIHPKVTSLDGDMDLFDLDVLNEPYHMKEVFEPCPYPWSSVHINTDGQLFPCLAISMGDVRHAPLTEIIQGEAFAGFRGLLRREGTLPGCNRCGWLRPRDKGRRARTEGSRR